MKFSLILFVTLFGQMSLQHLECRFEYTTFVWGEDIDFLEWSCNINDSNMQSATFDEKLHENVTSMHIIGISNASIPTKLNQKFPSLSSLRVELTDLKAFSGNDTKGLHNLKNLYLGNNNISDVTEAFNDHSQLKNLFLNGNNLKQLMNSTFKKLTNLEQLWLNDNYLTQLHFELLSENKNLNRVYLQNNRLLIIAEEAFHLPNLAVVDLRGNICINRWTFDTPMKTLTELAKKSCNPSVENMRKSSIIMAKFIHELSIRDIALHAKISEQSMVISELRERLSQYEEIEAYD